MCILFPFFFKFFIGIATLCVFLQIVHHGVAHCVGEGGLLTHQDVVGEIVSLKGMAEKIFSFVVDVHLLCRVHAHDVGYKIQVAEGYPGLHGVHADAPVSPEHIVHVELVDSLDRLFLEGLR